MAKGANRGNREAKKPKQTKKIISPSDAGFLQKPLAPRPLPTKGGK